MEFAPSAPSKSALTSWADGFSFTACRWVGPDSQGRPIVVTDSQENLSTEFAFDQVRALVEEQTASYCWAFQFIGADDTAMRSYRAAPAPMAAFSMRDDIPEENEL